MFNLKSIIMYCDYQKFQFEVIQDCVKTFVENQNDSFDHSDMDSTIMLAQRIINAASEIVRDCNNKQIVELLKTNSPFEEG